MIRSRIKIRRDYSSPKEVLAGKEGGAVWETQPQFLIGITFHFFLATGF